MKLPECSQYSWEGKSAEALELARRLSRAPTLSTDSGPLGGFVLYLSLGLSFVCCLLSSSLWAHTTQPFSSVIRWYSLAVRFRPIWRRQKGTVKVRATRERVQHEWEWRLATERRIGIEADGWITDGDPETAHGERDCGNEKMRLGPTASWEPIWPRWPGAQNGTERDGSIGRTDDSG
jgi:hypothetical protein